MDEVAALLHELRLRGRVPVPADEAVADRLVRDGLARPKGTDLLLTPAGRQAAERGARLAPGSGAEAHARRAYEAILALNPQVVVVCHESQASGEWAVIARLGTLDDRAGPIVSRLGREVDRFAGYRVRLRAARTRVEAGEREWFTSPRCDSYHTVWMQLHEDLLLALGLDRATEPA